MINVYLSQGKWKVKRQGAKRVDSIHDGEEDAVLRARHLADHGMLLKERIMIHGRDGSVERVEE